MSIKVPTEEQWSNLAKKISPSKSFYGTSDTAAGTVDKIVNCPAFTSNDFVAGTKLTVLFSTAESAKNPTLNVGGVTKAISHVGTNTNSRYFWQAGEAVDFVYDGTQFKIEKGGTAGTTYYGLTKLTNSVTSTSTTTAATPASVMKTYDSQHFVGYTNDKPSIATGYKVNATCEGFTTADLVEGQHVAVHFNQGMDLSMFTLNVNGTGDITVATGFSNNASTGQMNTSNYPAGVYDLVYKTNVDTWGSDGQTVENCWVVTSAPSLGSSDAINSVKVMGTALPVSSGSVNITNATTSAYGVTKLNASSTNTWTNIAATPSAVKNVADVTSSAFNMANNAFNAANNAYNLAQDAYNAANNAGGGSGGVSLTLSNVDLGPNMPLAAGTLYGVYE